MGQLPILFFRETNTHTHKRERENGSNTKEYHNSTQKSWWLLREDVTSYTIHNTLLSNIGQLPILFFLDTNKHTQREGGTSYTTHNTLS